MTNTDLLTAVRSAAAKAGWGLTTEELQALVVLTCKFKSECEFDNEMAAAFAVESMEEQDAEWLTARRLVSGLNALPLSN